MKLFTYFLIIYFFIGLTSCKKDDASANESQNSSSEWQRAPDGPVFRDFIPAENYQAASDAHVFYSDNDLKMIYTGDFEGSASIKLASGSDWTNWTAVGTLLGTTGPSGMDTSKETAFYRYSTSGKHQIYYIGYEDEESYEAQIFLAESDNLEGPYTQLSAPVVPKGIIAGRNIYCMTSPSVVEHQSVLYMTFIGWDNSPSEVTEVWVIGATSFDDGITWGDFEEVDTRIGMEGQVTKVNDNEYISVRTGDFENTEAIFYATASHPYGPWDEQSEPIIVRAGAPHEVNEVIAPQITIDSETGEKVLYYTGADYAIGWWIMMATAD